MNRDPSARRGNTWRSTIALALVASVALAACASSKKTNVEPTGASSPAGVCTSYGPETVTQTYTPAQQKQLESSSPNAATTVYVEDAFRPLRSITSLTLGLPAGHDAQNDFAIGQEVHALIVAQRRADHQGGNMPNVGQAPFFENHGKLNNTLYSMTAVGTGCVNFVQP